MPAACAGFEIQAYLQGIRIPYTKCQGQTSLLPVFSHSQDLLRGRFRTTRPELWLPGTAKKTFEHTVNVEAAVRGGCAQILRAAVWTCFLALRHLKGIGMRAHAASLPLYCSERSSL